MKRLITCICVITLCMGCSTSSTTASTSASNSGTTQATPEPTPEQTDPTFGSTITFDGYELTFGASYEIVTIENQYSSHNGEQVIELPVHVKNTNEETGSLNMFYMTYFGSKGTQLDSITGEFMDTNIEFAGELRSGSEYDSNFYFLYDGDGTYYIEFDNFSDKIEAAFDIQA